MSRNVKIALAVIFGLVATMVSMAFAADPVVPWRTQIRLLTPFGTKGLSDGIQIADKATGKCSAPSAASPSPPDAWRCSAGNAILDPCFQQIMGNEKEFACAVEGPWSRKVIVLTITEPLPTEPRKAVSRDTTPP